MFISKLFYIDDNIISIHLRYPLRFTHYGSHSVYPYMQPIEEQFPKRKIVVADFCHKTCHNFSILGTVQDVKLLL